MGPIENVKTSLVRSEMNPQFAAIVLPTDLVIVTRFEIELEQDAGNLVVCLPYSMIEPLGPSWHLGSSRNRRNRRYVAEDA